VKLERGDADGALARLTAGTGEAPQLAEGQYWLGRALLAKGETVDAVSRLRRAFQLDPQARYALHLGAALERSNALEEALEAYRAAAAADPKAFEPHERIALLFAANNHCDEAIPAYERAVAAAPRLSRLKIGLGDCELKLGKAPDATRTFREVLKADPAAVEVLYRLGRAVHEAEGSRAATPWYERAAREEKKNPMPHYYLGYAYKERGQRQRAIEAFKTYLALKPDAEERKDIEAEIEDLGGKL